MKSDMILGVGNDIIEIARIRHSLEEHGEKFLNRIFTPKEQAYCLGFQDPAPHLAARFAGKEAISKALGCGIGKSLSWLDLEILNSPEGKPQVFCSLQLKKIFNIPIFLISLSHSKEYATAVALWIKS